MLIRKRGRKVILSFDLSRSRPQGERGVGGLQAVGRDGPLAARPSRCLSPHKPPSPFPGGLWGDSRDGLRGPAAAGFSWVVRGREGGRLHSASGGSRDMTASFAGMALESLPTLTSGLAGLTWHRTLPTFPRSGHDNALPDRFFNHPERCAWRCAIRPGLRGAAAACCCGAMPLALHLTWHLTWLLTLMLPLR